MGRIGRREFLGIGASTALLTTVGCPLPQPMYYPPLLPEPPAQPNVLLIAIDDVSKRFGCYGDTFARTPNIDWLAGRGMVFDNHYVQTASCGPSRACLLTGMYPDTTRVWHNLVDFRTAWPDTKTVAEQFKNAGYRTKPIGKVAHLDRHQMEPRSWTYPLSQRIYPGPLYIDPHAQAKRKLYDDSEAPPDRYHDWHVAELAIQTLTEWQTVSQPWFLALGFNAPHLPFVVSKPYWEQFESTRVRKNPQPFRPIGMSEFNKVSREVYSYKVSQFGSPISRRLGRKLVRGHYAAISFMDEQLGRVLDYLESSPFADNTLIVLWSDNGFHLGEQEQWGKAALLDMSQGTPLMFSAPWLPTGRTDTLCETVDLYPTMCELAGLSVPAEVEGKSMVPTLFDPSVLHKELAFSQYFQDFFCPDWYRVWGYSVRTARYRYNEWRQNNSTLQGVELYDYAKSVQEKRNIVSEPKYRDVVTECADLLDIMWAGSYEKTLGAGKWDEPWPEEWLFD